jgi:hypothetical protein
MLLGPVIALGEPGATSLPFFAQVPRESLTRHGRTVKSALSCWVLKVVVAACGSLFTASCMLVDLPDVKKVAHALIIAAHLLRQLHAQKRVGG